MYLKTDLSYIFVHIYELLSGFGWKNPEDGYNQLLSLWTTYRDEHPKLDHYLLNWLFDFAQLHNLEYRIPDCPDVSLPYQPAIRDILIDAHSTEKPLKLSFALIDALCDYSLVNSKFYKEGHQLYMLDVETEGVHRIRAVVKDEEGYSRIYKTAYDSRIAPDSQKDTLTPIINALGMNLNDTFGPAKDKINIVTEGMSDYIYICTMAKQLGVSNDKYAIIPSVGASNCVNLCSILHGWGCKYIAVFDYDKAGVESGGEYLRKNMFFEQGKQYCYMKEVSQREIDSKTYKSDAGKYMVEDLVTKEELDRFCSFANIDINIGKSLVAKLLSNAVEKGTYTLGKDCIENFKSLFARISIYVS